MHIYKLPLPAADGTTYNKYQCLPLAWHIMCRAGRKTLLTYSHKNYFASGTDLISLVIFFLCFLLLGQPLLTRKPS